VFEVDPLRCAACGGTMRVIAFILDPVVIRKILQHRPRPEPWGDEKPAGLGSGDRRPRGPVRTAAMARRMIEFPTLRRGWTSLA
jgi:hypothetical protein